MTVEPPAHESAGLGDDRPAPEHPKAARTKVGVGLGAIAAAVALFVVWGEWQGWPFLAAPLERKLSSVLQREVSFSADNGDRSAVRINLLGGLRIRAPRIRIAAPDWSQAPHLLLATDALHFGGLTGVFTLAGPSLAAVGDPLGITLPTTPAFRTEGRIAKRGQVWNAVFDSAHIGASRLTGAFTYDAGRTKPILAGRLGGSKLLLADLGPAIGSKGQAPAAPRPRAAKASGRVLPDREFDLPSLGAMDANILIDVAEVDLGTSYLEPLRPLRAHLTLADAVLRLDDIETRTAQGRLAGTVQLDGRAARAVWTTALRVNDVRLERWVKQVRADGGPPYVSGRLRGVINLRGEGRSTAQILGSLKGNVGLQLRDGKISHLVIESAGIDIAQALGLMVRGDKSLDVLCGVADLQATAGVLRPRTFVIDTTDSTVSMDGSISLVNESMDLRAVVSPKDFSPLTLRTPVHVRGSLGEPKVSLEKGPLARQLAASALLALVTPVAALLPLIDPGDPAAADQAVSEGCRALAQRSRAPTAGNAAASDLPAPQARQRRR